MAPRRILTLKKPDRVAIDFDGVIVTHDGWIGHGQFGTVIPGVREFCVEVQKRGYEIVIFTSRLCEQFTPKSTLSFRKNEIEIFLNDQSIPFDEVWLGIGKPAAVAYVDDRGVFCDPQHDQFAFEDALVSIDKLSKRPI